MSNPDDMDQFMNDFLEGKFLEDKPTSNKVSVRRHSHAAHPRRSSKTKEAPEDGGPTRGVRRTKSGDHGTHRPSHGRHQPHRRSKRASETAAHMMDPQAVIRMMEMYADADDQEKADEMLHYGQKSPRNSITEKSLQIDKNELGV